MSQPVEKLAYSIAEASKAVSLSQATIYAMLADGRLRRVKIGRRNLIPRDSFEALFAAKPTE
nr:helix-turn-helix domain-containing protein [uncultured Brevundimonas sp.]